MWETQVRSLGEEDPLENEIATHSSILAWRVPMDRGAWWATVRRVAKSWTHLSLSAIPSLQMYLREMKAYMCTKKICTKIFIVALFIIANVHHPRWKDKYTVEWYMAIKTTGSYYNIDEPWKHYAKWKKPSTKDHMLYDSDYMKCAKWANLCRWKVNSWQRPWWFSS